MARKSHETRVKLVKFGPLKSTRYPELQYQNRGDHWRIVSEDEAGVGPFYATQTELLADLDRYAEAYGCI